MATFIHQEGTLLERGEKRFGAGYYGSPTLSETQIVFVSEDDLWTVPIDGGLARRLSSGLGKVSSPALSRDGQTLAFTSTEEGHPEVFAMPAEGGEAERLTYLGAETKVIGWNRNGEIIFASNHQHAFARLTDLYTLSLDQGDSSEIREIKRVKCGPATHLDFDEGGRAVIARRGGTDLAYWKRYRGGTAGEIWIDHEGKGNFEKLLKQKANTARPFWIKNRIFFISDHEGVGNIYSVEENGQDLKRHTDCRDFYARGLSVCGEKLVFTAGGDIFILDISLPSEKVQKVQFHYRSPKTQVNRRFVSAIRYLEDYDLHPCEERAVIAARGKTFSFDLWKGPVIMHGQEGPVRNRLGRFSKDGSAIALISDVGGEEVLEVHDIETRMLIKRFDHLDLGRSLNMKISPVKDEALFTNHRNELILVHLSDGALRVLDRSQHSQISGYNWSPDGRFVAYSVSITPRRNAIKVIDLQTGRAHQVTEPVLWDAQPFFDPSGEYLYFLSYRDFDPVYDNMHFDLSFPRGCRPCLLTLRKDVLSPFSTDHPGRTGKSNKSNNTNNYLANSSPSEEKNRIGRKDSKPETQADSVRIDFEGICDRIVAFPVSDGRYGQIAATKEKVYFTRYPIRGSLSAERRSNDRNGDANLEMFDLESERVELIAAGVSSFRISRDGRRLVYRSGHDLRVIKTNEKPSRDQDENRKGGWLDLSRVQVPVRPRDEWRQMYREAWRLQRDHFWDADMSNIDWNRVYERYLPLLDRVGSRSEVSDLIWEMQGELGTSHAYEIGGDYRPDPNYGIGFLGADFEYVESTDGSNPAYRLTRVLKGDLWDESCSSPLARAGLGLKIGDEIVAIDGQALTREHKPHQSLVHKAGREVAVTFRRQGSSELRTRSVKTLKSEQKLRYREWVEANRRFVKKGSLGRVGYIHIPNMGPFGYSEFHRAFLTELDCEALIVDVRFNGGGHVSQLLLEKLARKRIAYSKSRWFGTQPYPSESPMGPMVALTNEYAGSDGDIFSHAFKLLKLGPLVGKRTWGGVIGISPSHSLVDGGITTQPEYSFWFEDVGWRVENYGTDPDIEIDVEPADYARGLDPQLAMGLRLCLASILEKSGDQSNPLANQLAKHLE